MEAFLEKRLWPGVDPGPGRKYMDLYHGRSGRLSPGHVAEDLSRGRSGQGDPWLDIWITPWPAEIGQRIEVHSQMRALDPASVVASGAVVTLVDDEQGRVISTVHLESQGITRELTASFTAPLPPANVVKSDGTFTPRAVTARVVARGTISGRAFARSAEVVFFVQKMAARIVESSCRLERPHGDIVLRFDIQVRRPGTYYAEAEIWSTGENARAIAFGRERMVGLSQGTHSVELLFGGLVLRDTGIDGPYAIRNLELMQVDTLPPHQSPVIRVVAETPAWLASTFQ